MRERYCTCTQCEIDRRDEARIIEVSGFEPLAKGKYVSILSQKYQSKFGIFSYLMHAPRSLGRLKKTRPTASACRLIALDVVLNRIHIDKGKEITVNDLNPGLSPLEGFGTSLSTTTTSLRAASGPITKSSIRRQQFSWKSSPNTPDRES